MEPNSIALIVVLLAAALGLIWVIVRYHAGAVAAKLAGGR